MLFSATDKSDNSSDLVNNTLAMYAEARMIGDARATVYFNISNTEFQAYVSSNSINYLNIEVSILDENNNTVPVSNLEIVEPDVFDIETAGVDVENLSEKYQQLFIGVYVNDELCSELRLVPYVIKEMPDMAACGETVDLATDPDADNMSLSDLTVGDILSIKGFQIKISEITNALEFTGIMPLPFDCSSAQVSFSGITVNSEYQITSGTVTGKMGNMDGPDFSMYDLQNIGGDICVDVPEVSGAPPEEPEESKGEDRGFDPETGEHTITGTSVDPEGFNIDGQFVNGDGSTSEFNPQGCNRQGMDMEGNVCDASAGPNPKADKYVQENEAQLNTQIDELLASLSSSISTQVNAQRTTCNSYRQAILNFVDGKDYESLVLGENLEYVEEDMHTEFATEPKILIGGPSGRSAGIVKCEADHVELYHCDKELSVLKDRKDSFEEILPTLEAKLKEQILQDIANMTEFVFNETFPDNPTPEQMETSEAWIQSRIEFYADNPEILQGQTVEDEEEGQGLVDHETEDDKFVGLSRKERKALEKKQKVQARLAEAFKLSKSLSTLDQKIVKRKVKDQQEIDFINSSLADQKSKSIYGVDKAFYIEELYYQRFNSKKSNSFNLLPLQIPNPFGDEALPIYITGFSITASNDLNDIGGVLDAVMLIKDPNSDSGIVFRAEQVAFGAGGFVGGDSKLILETEVNIRLNNAALLILNPVETNVTWNCHGFQSLNLSGGIEFCREFITPLTKDLKVIKDPARYRLGVDVQGITSWNEFYLEVNAPPFAVTKYEDIKWELNKMVLDFSSKKTPAIMPLMGYESENYNPTSNTFSPQWKGFFIDKISASFPKDLGGLESTTEVAESDVEEPDNDNNENEPVDGEIGPDRPGYVKISGNSIVIDDTGFSGMASIQASEGASIFEGSLSGWGYSVDGIEITVLNNDFAGTGFTGGIQLPILEEPMDYEGLIYPESKFSFTVTPGADFTSNLFLADVTIEKSSSIKLAKDDEGFLATANLTGSLSINTALQSDAIQIQTPDLCFQGLTISNRPLYFQAGDWGFKDGTPSVAFNFAGFSASLTDIQPYSPALGKAGVKFQLGLSLVESLTLEATGNFGILGNLVINDADQQKWEFEKIDVMGFSIDAQIKEIARVKGALKWYNDPDWGKGFLGNLEAQFNISGESGFGFGLAAAAQFGNFSGDKYFYVDALATLPVGVPIGPLEIYGFGGGVSYNMSFEKEPDKLNDDDLNGGNGENEEIVSSVPSTEFMTAGTTASGAKYMYDPTIGLGFKAIAAFRTIPINSVFNGSLSFGMFLNDGGGINNIFLKGNGQFFAEPVLSLNTEFTENATQAPSLSSPLSAFVSMELNFADKTLHGNLRAFLDAYKLKGNAGPVNSNILVDGTVHFSPSDWYIWLGVPENSPAPFSGGPAGFSLDLDVTQIEAKAYFDIGTLTPPMPALPSTVSQLAGRINDNASLRRSGQGFVAGASFGITAGLGAASTIRADLTAEAGFDIMLRKYEDVNCADDEEQDGIGINGWYAVGQMWAYLTGSVKIFGFEVFKAGIAAILQAQLPNPFFAQATLAVRVKLLFATINKRLSVSFGKPCELVPDDGGAIALDLISQIIPVDSEEDVSTLVNAKVFFTVPLLKEFEFPGANNVTTFRATVDEEDVVMTRADGTVIPSRFLYGEDNLSIDVIPLIELPGSSDVTLKVKVKVFKKASNGAYAFVDDQEEESTFTTSPSFENIPTANIENAYPYDGQMNFHQDQLDEFFIDLVIGQQDLFRNIPEDVNQELVLTTSNGFREILEYRYDGLNSRIIYKIPTELEGNRVYKLELSRSSGDETAVLYSMYFRASIYSTAQEKIASFKEEIGSTGVNEYSYFSIEDELISYDEFENGIYEFEALLPIAEQTKIGNVLQRYRNYLPSDITVPFYNELDLTAFTFGGLQATPRRISQSDYATGVIDFSGGQTSGRQTVFFTLGKSLSNGMDIYFRDYIMSCSAKAGNDIDCPSPEFEPCCKQQFLPLNYDLDLESVSANVMYTIPGSVSFENTLEFKNP